MVYDVKLALCLKTSWIVKTKHFSWAFSQTVSTFSYPRCFHTEKASRFPIFRAEVMKYVSANPWKCVNYFISEMRYFSMKHSKFVISVRCCFFKKQTGVISLICGVNVLGILILSSRFLLICMNSFNWTLSWGSGKKWILMTKNLGLMIFCLNYHSHCKLFI